MNAPIAQSENTPADFGAPRNASSTESDEATVRKFRTYGNVGPKVPSDGRKLTSIFFDQDSDVIGWQYHPFLRQIADALAENPNASAVVEGHTDNSGPESYNLDLSSRRAMAIRNALVNELHVSGAQLKAIGVGSAAPVQPNSTASGRAYNRRVDVRVWNSPRADQGRHDAL
jgi:outer membrane protein OmpA-like peptidoglycan-associated protein